MEPDLSTGTGTMEAPRQSEPDMEYLEGVSPSMRPVEVVIGELALNDVPVLLLAESGAGKRTTARRIHETSSRSGQPFGIVACATLTPEAFDMSGPGTFSVRGRCFWKK